MFNVKSCTLISTIDQQYATVDTYLVRGVGSRLQALVSVYRRHRSSEPVNAVAITQFGELSFEPSAPDSSDPLVVGQSLMNDAMAVFYEFAGESIYDELPL